MVTSFRNTILIVLLFLLTSSNSFAQYDGAVTTVTPNAAALFKTVQRPVGSYTGTTPINIALFSVSSGDLQVPVSLNYSNGGIRVEEIASWAGLGWNVSTGGQITRVVNGVPDDDAGGMLNASLKPSGLTLPGNSSPANIDRIIKKDLDMEPDLYYFDCNGLSGKFYFDESGNPHMVSQKAIKIEKVMISNVIKGWVITDEKGNKYYFGMDKNQTANYVDQSSMTYTSAAGYTTSNLLFYISTWHLAEIRDINEINTIKFSYTNYNTSFETISGSYMALSGTAIGNCAPSDRYGDDLLVTNNTAECYLDKIEGGNDSLVFHSSVGRLDFVGGRRLDSIKLFSKNNHFVKRYNFSYGYFSSDMSGANTYVKRLKLNTLSEFGPATNDSLTHRFQYIETVNLPHRLSKGTDYWGYYNGKDNNWTSLPNGVYQTGYTYKVDNLGDRRTNPYYSIANTLKKITYPTGGTREFIYEGNQTLLEYNYQIQPDASFYSSQSFSEPALPIHSSLPVVARTFTINSSEGSSDFSYYLGASYWYGEAIVKIIRILGPGNEYEVMSFNGQISNDWVLDNGDYRIEVYCYGSDITNISCRWEEQKFSTATQYRFGQPYIASNINVGGIRVKQVNDYDPVSGKNNTTSYAYNLFSDSTLTSGMLVSPVRVAHVGSCQYAGCQYVRLSSQSAFPLSTEGGSYVVYPEVRTYESGNGHTDRTYTFEFDRSPGSFELNYFPVTPAFDASWIRNRIQLERIYNNNNQLIKESSFAGNGWGIVYDPVSYNITIQNGWKVEGYYDGGTLINSCRLPYILQSQFTDVATKREKLYNAGGTSQEILTEYDYYSSIGQPLLKEERVYLNNGALRKTDYKYAFNNTADFVFGLTTPEQTMKTTLLGKNYMEPLEVTTTVTPQGGSPVLTGGAKFAFNTFNGTNIHLANLKQYSSVTDYKETNFSAYDTKGNLEEKYQASGPKEVYLWGYYGTYPVAKITGSSFSTVNAYVNPAILNNPSSDTALQAHLNTIRTTLAGTGSPNQMNSYTYKPLVGMTSTTDARGQTTFFEYDNFSRLKNKKDNEGNIIESIQYHYKP